MSSPEPGEIVVDEAGNVTIGLPTATSVAEAPVPDGDAEEDED